MTRIVMVRCYSCGSDGQLQLSGPDHGINDGHLSLKTYEGYQVYFCSGCHAKMEKEPCTDFSLSSRDPDKILDAKVARAVGWVLGDFRKHGKLSWYKPDPKARDGHWWMCWEHQLPAASLQMDHATAAQKTFCQVHQLDFVLFQNRFMEDRHYFAEFRTHTTPLETFRAEHEEPAWAICEAIVMAHAYVTEEGKGDNA